MIRAARKADIPRILDLLDALNAQGTLSDPSYRVKPDARETMRETCLRDWFGRFLPFPACLVDEEEGEVAGMISGRAGTDHPLLDRPPMLHIETLFVDEAWRRRGIARALVAAYREAAARAGYAHAEVGTLARDARALAFWRAVGFTDRRVILASA